MHMHAESCILKFEFTYPVGRHFMLKQAHLAVCFHVQSVMILSFFLRVRNVKNEVAMKPFPS